MKTKSASRVDVIFRAFSDRTRLRILHMLRGGELCVCEIVDVLDVPLSPGDLMLLCSDGFYEATNTAGEAFGVARVGEVLRANRAAGATEVLSALRDSVDTFRAGSRQLDDMTAVAIKRIG